MAIVIGINQLSSELYGSTALGPEVRLDSFSCEPTGLPHSVSSSGVSVSTAGFSGGGRKGSSVGGREEGRRGRTEGEEERKR